MLYSTALWMVFGSFPWLTADMTSPGQPQLPATPSLRHLEKKIDGMQVAESAHFRIVHDQDKKIVAKVAKVAEDTRLALQKKWFGDDSIDWDGRCTIYLHANREKYASKTGLRNTLGHMRTLTWGDGVQMRSIHLPCKEPNLFEDVLPHEVCHSVLAVRFQGKTPRWADEGMAMLAESPAGLADCLGQLPKYRRTDSLFALEILMQTEETDHFQTQEFYSQSASLVQFLSSKKGPQVFTGFLRASIQSGYAKAFVQYYGIKSFSDLERQWQAFAFSKK